MDPARYQKLESLFAEAVELPADAQQAFLDRECGDDHEIRDELAQLLEHDAAEGLEIPDANESATEPSSTKPPQVEGYETLNLIGQGGMGQVWRAVQLSTRREVALKVLPYAGRRSSNARARFEREAELAARIAHPNVARIYASGIFEGGTYYAMELVEGVDLSSYVEQIRPCRTELIELMSKVCRAVEQAHHRGVIHQDLKPTNILVRKDGEPILVDFGVATSLSTESRDSRVPAAGVLFGTPSYMSPEQVSADVDRIDTRSDVYSLGVILYQLVLGRPPTEPGDTPLETVRRVVDEEIASPRAVDPTCDASLAAVIMKALAKDPDDRYGNAGQLAQDLENLLRKRPVSARRITIGYVLTLYLRRHYLRVTAVVAFLALLVSTAIGYVIVTKRHEQQAVALAKQAELERREAVAAKDNADHLSYINLLRLANAGIENHNYHSADGYLNEVATDLRGWEWRLLKNLSQPRDVSLWHTAPFKDNINRIVFSPDGTRLAAAAGRSTTKTTIDPFILVVDTGTGETVSELRGHEDGIFALTFTPDGRQILSGGRDGVLRRWDVETGAELEAFQPPFLDLTENTATMLFDIRFGPQNRRVAFAIYPVGLFVTEVAGEISWQDLFQRKRHVVAISGEDDWIKFTNDGSRIYWSTRRWQGNIGHLFVLDAETGEQLHHLQHGGNNPIHSVDLSPDENDLLIATAATVDRLDPTSLSTVAMFRGHRGRVRRAFYLPSGEKVVSIARDEGIRFWNVNDCSTDGVMYVRPGTVPTEIRLSPSGQELAVALGRPDYRLRMFRVNDVATHRCDFTEHDGNVREIALSPDEAHLLSVGDDGWAKLTSTKTREPVWQNDQGHGRATATTFSRDGETVVIGRSLHPDTHPPPHGQLVFLDRMTGHQVRDPMILNGWIWDIEFDPKGKRLAVAMGISAVDPASSGSTVILDATTLAPLHELKVEGPRCREVAWSPDGHLVATVAEQQLAVWDTATGKRIRSNMEHGGRNFVRFSRDGRTLLTATGDTLEFRDPQTLSQMGIYEQKQLTNQSFSFSMLGDALVTPDGSRLISGSWNSNITVWDIEKGVALLVFKAHDAGIHGITMTSDGRALYSFAHDGRVRRWSADRAIEDAQPPETDPPATPRSSE